MSRVPVQSRAATYPFAKIALAGVIAIVLSLVANLAVRWLGLLLIEVPADLQPLASISPVLFFTALFIGVATIVWAVVTRVSATPRKTWNLVAALGFLLSLVPDFGLLMQAQPTPMGTFTTGATIILIVMHVFSGIITWWALPQFSRA